jgi:hypothetical protein
MKPKCLIVFLLLFTSRVYSQSSAVLDYKLKTAANAKERTEMLDALRNYIYKDLKITLEFYVDHLKVGNNYAWFEGSAGRKDGKKLKFPEDGDYDCCHVEALFQKRLDKWEVAESAPFSTDVWYGGIGKKYPAAPKTIFPKDSPALEGAEANILSKPAQKKLPANNRRLVHILKDAKGNPLGDVYIEDFKSDVFNKLLITKQKGGKIDTLYFINNYLFTNPKGTDITFSKENFNGYKIEFFKGDSFQLFGIGKNGNETSDPATIVWNYQKKIFEVFQTP